MRPPLSHLLISFFRFVFAYSWVAYLSIILHQNRLYNGLAIGKLFHFLCSLLTPKIPCRFSCSMSSSEVFIFQGSVVTCVSDIICVPQLCRHTNELVSVMIWVRGECVSKQVTYGHWELCVLYCTVKLRAITLHTTYLLSHIKPAGGPLTCCRYTLSRIRGVDRQVV